MFWRTLLLAGVLSCASLWAHAEPYQTLPSTPDLSIATNTTDDVRWAGKATWIYVRNDCASPIYFSLNGAHRDAVYPLRLNQNQAFEGPIVSTSLGVSSGSSGTCTYTLVIAR